MKKTTFDPNAAAAEDSGVFGLPCTLADAALVYLPVPWEATTSYGGGTSNAPEAILAASRQVDLFDLDVEKPYSAGLFMRETPPEVKKWNTRAKKEAQKIIALGGDLSLHPMLKNSLHTVNELSGKLNAYVYEETKSLLAQGKIVGVIGGDHAVPWGAFKAISETVADFGILHFDAHSDTRNAYEGFQWSHASIIRNALERIPQISKVVQVGIRDVCEEEMEFTLAEKKRMSVFYDRDLQNRKFEGQKWGDISREIIALLPQNVWVSFDIDGLDPKYCPHTGTPVAGGLELAEANYLLALLVKSGRKILGFDLNEVSPGKTEWDANVGARLLYKLSAWTLASQGLAKVRT